MERGEADEPVGPRRLHTFRSSLNHIKKLVTPSENDKNRNREREEDKYVSEGKNNTEEFYSENFRIELGGLPKYYNLSQLKKLLNIDLQLDAQQVKPGGMGRNVAFVTFKDDGTSYRAITFLNGYKWQGVTLSAKKADPTKDPALLAKINYLKVPKKEYEHLPLNERIQKIITPYHDMAYEDQIMEKENVAKLILKKFGNELATLNPELKDFVRWQKIRRSGQVCEIDSFVQSPVTRSYCNRCEFIIGKSRGSGKPVIGFRVASYKEGSVEVGPVEHLTHLNDKVKEVVKYMEDFLETSLHNPFDPFTHKGVWQQLTVRTSENYDVMIIVQIHPQNFSEEDVNEMKDDVKNYFTVGSGGAVGVTSIYFQQVGEGKVGKEVEYEHVYGKTYIEETILGKTFRASPDSFLQVNPAASEVLYEKIAELADVDATSILLDICCGVGSIGLSVAESSYKIMGVEASENAVEDARINAETNGIANAAFYHGKAEEYIENMIERSQRSNVIAIIDPPGPGIGLGVMKSLRKCECLNKIVFVSSDPQAALPNFQALVRGRSNSYKGSYFVPIRATPVDLFPDTPQFELIIVFERYDDCKWDRIMSGNPRPKDQEYFNRIPQFSEDDYYEESEEEIEKPKKKKGGEKRAGIGWGDGGRSVEWEDDYADDSERKGGGRELRGYNDDVVWDGYDGRKRGGDYDDKHWDVFDGRKRRGDYDDKHWDEYDGRKRRANYDDDRHWDDNGKKQGSKEKVFIYRADDNDDQDWDVYDRRKIGGREKKGNYDSDEDWNRYHGRKRGGSDGIMRGGNWKRGGNLETWNLGDATVESTPHPPPPPSISKWNRNFNSEESSSRISMSSMLGPHQGLGQSSVPSAVSPPPPPRISRWTRNADSGESPSIMNLASTLLPSSVPAAVDPRESRRNEADLLGNGMQKNANEYKEGFQEGIQTILKALSGQLPPGFGQVGGLNMAPTQIDVPYNSRIPSGNIGVLGAETKMGSQGPYLTQFGINPGSSRPYPASLSNQSSVNQDYSGSYPAHLLNKPVTYPTSLTNPKQVGQGFSDWNQGSSFRGGNYQRFNEPAAKKWRSNQ